MNGSRDSVRDLVAGVVAGLRGVKDIEALVCPSVIHIPLAAELLAGSGVALGAQNVCQEDDGAYTGETAAGMLAEYGCRYVIVGHSERRHVYAESDGLVARRFAAALRHGLAPILCVGERLEEREAGDTESVVNRQFQAVVDQVGGQALAGSVIAYEPVWAIGTGKTAAPEQAQNVHAFIRDLLRRISPDLPDNVRLLYGGSVKAGNAAGLFAMDDIDGALVGGASLNAHEFVAICRSAAR